MTLAQIAPSEPFCLSVEESTTASRTLTNAILRTTQVYTGTAQGDWTLPAASSFTDGQHFIVLNGTSNKQLTLTHAGSDTILRNGDVTTLTLAPGESGVFESNGVDEFTFTGTSLRTTPSSRGSKDGVARKCYITLRFELADVTALGATPTGSIDTGFDFPANGFLTAAGLLTPTASGGVTLLNIALEANSVNIAEITNAGAGANQSGVLSTPTFPGAGNITLEFVATGGNLDAVTGLDDGIIVALEYLEETY